MYVFLKKKQKLFLFFCLFCLAESEKMITESEKRTKRLKNGNSFWFSKEKNVRVDGALNIKMIFS